MQAPGHPRRIEPWSRNQETTRAPTPRRVPGVRSSKNWWFRDPCEASNRGPTLTNWKPPSEWLACLRSGKPRRSFAARLPRDKGSAAVGYPGRSGRETKATGSHAATDMISRLVLWRAKPKHTAATSAAKPEKKNAPPGAPPKPAGGEEGAEGRGESLGSGGCPGAPRECVAPPDDDRPRESFTGVGEEGWSPKATVTSASVTGIGEATHGSSGDGPGVIDGPGSRPGSVGGGTVSVGGGPVSVGGTGAGSVGVGTAPASPVAVGVPASGVSAVSSARLVAAKTSASANEAAKSASRSGR